MAEKLKPELWSDFDGTAVEIVSKANPRNWSKYPLAAIEGYLDFLKGVRGGGVAMAGIVSRRPNILPRRVVTARSVAQLGIDAYFSNKGQIVLAGSEEAKAEVIVDASSRVVVGMIDDKPHKLGESLLGALRADYRGGVTGKEIVLGAVAHKRTAEHMEAFAEFADKWSATVHSGAEVTTEPGAVHVVDKNSFALHVVQIDPYSCEAGQEFAEVLTDISQLRV